MPEETELIQVDGWVYRQRIPAQPGPYPLILMLHGWTGDENAMWIFASRLPRTALLAAPRGLYSTPLGGYGWHAHKAQAWPQVDDFQPAIQALLEFLTPLRFPQADFSRLYLLGFSQGAALAGAFTLLYPERVCALAGLAGFLPEGVSTLAFDKRQMQNKPVFLAHGTRDELVPVAKARQTVAFLDEAGAQVTYCEDEVGHKLSAACFRSLQAFFEEVC